MADKRVLPPPLAAPKNFAAKRHVERVAAVPYTPIAETVVEIFGRSEVRHKKLLKDDPGGVDPKNEEIPETTPETTPETKEGTENESTKNPDAGVHDALDRVLADIAGV